MTETPTNHRSSEGTRTFSTDRTIERDDRIDLFRGLALMVIFIDHVELLNGVSIVSQYTLRSIGLCDATEVFVFISGYVCGLRYWPVLVKDGYRACQIKALKRVGQLWLANLITLALVLNFVLLSADVGGFAFETYRLGGLSDPLSQLIPRVLLQMYQPALFDVLTLYMLLLLVLPLFLCSMNSRPALTWISVLGIYIAIQFFPWFNYPLYDFHSGGLLGAARTFNNFGWQLLFFIGATLGIRRKQGQRHVVPGIVVVACGVAVIVIALGRLPLLTYLFGESLLPFQKIIRSLVWSPFALKLTQGPVRLAYFLMLATCATAIVPSKFGNSMSRVIHPLVNAGQNPLAVFCLGVFLSFAGHPLLKMSLYSTWVVVIYDLFGCGLMMWAGVLLSRRKARRLWSAAAAFEPGVGT